jgi:tetratricopeptide (TPR) repeat protein
MARLTRRWISALLVTGVIAGGGWFGAHRLSAFEPSPDEAGPTASATMSEIADRDTQIRVWSVALAQDSGSAIALSQLAALYLQRARESGDDRNYNQAEDYARRSLKLRVNRNGPAFVTLAAALVAQHRFQEAEVVARDLVAFDPDVPQYRAQLGEIQMELGRYDAARQSFDSLYNVRTHLSIAPRLARWAEINGNVSYARKLLSDALDAARLRRELPREQLAWFHLRLGDIDLRNGHTRRARSLFETGLKIEPDDYRLLDAMSHLEAVEGSPRKAIEYGERGIAIKLDPATLGTIGDAYAALGDSARAEQYHKTMEMAVAGQPGAYHRAWSLFLLDHNRSISEVLANVRAEIETRKDVYGYDLLAWAFHKEHRDAEAREAMMLARRLGTRDAMLFYHAGMIERSLGDAGRARYFLRLALEVNPSFHPRHPIEIRAVLDSIESEPRR